MHSTQGIQTLKLRENGVPGFRSNELGNELLSEFREIKDCLKQLAEHFAPQPGDKVGTPYVAKRLGCTTDWVAVVARDGEIPKNCVVEGTGNGKPWRFHRSRINEWIEGR